MIEDVARMAFVVQVSLADEELLQDFGYRREAKVKEYLTRRIMKALAEHPYLVGIEVIPVEEIALALAQEKLDEEVGDD